MPKPINNPPTKELLEELYCRNQYSQRDIATRLGISQTSVRRLLVKCHIIGRNKSDASKAMYKTRPDVVNRCGRPKHPLGNKYQKYCQEVRLAIRPLMVKYKTDKTCEQCGSCQDLQVHHSKGFSDTFTSLINDLGCVLDAQVAYISQHYAGLIDLVVLCRQCHIEGYSSQT